MNFKLSSVIKFWIGVSLFGLIVKCPALAENQDKVFQTLRIPARLLTRIFTTNQSFPQIVRVEVVEDVFEPHGLRTLIHKGSVGIGLTDSGSLNEQMGNMDITITELIEPSGKSIKLDFDLGSADGNPGLYGQVFNMKGKRLAGHIVRHFNPKVANWFSMNSVNQFSGKQIAETLPFQNVFVKLATKIFYVPKEIPVILYYSYK
jgi:hypothetical protein